MRKMCLIVATAVFMVSSAMAAAKSCSLVFRGYKGTTALTDFPALVRLPAMVPGFSYADFAAGDGSDIWFTDEQGNVISHEIDTWNATGDSYIWVKVPKIIDSTTYITMHWGETRSAGQAVATTGVWAGYKGVWHMSESGGTAADSTGNNLVGTPSGSASADMVADTGVVGNARVNARSIGNGVGYLSIPSYTLGNTFTVSGWFKAFGAFSDFERIFSRKEDWTKAGWEVYFCQHPAKVGVEGNDSKQVNNLPIPSVQNEWVNIVAVYSGSTCTLYVNGVRVGGGTVAAPTDNGLPLSIGSSSDGGYMSFYGKYDEVRLCGGALGADRVLADYMTMATPEEFLMFVGVDVAMTAHWTGTGDPANLLDPANWACTNIFGREIVGGVPTNVCTKAVVSGEVDFQFPNVVAPPWQQLVIGDLTLQGDADWRGLGNKVVLSGTINLNGHRLWLSDFPAGGSGAIVSSDDDEYIECSYLESSGSQYIDTKYLHDASTVVDFRMEFVGMSGDWVACFGARSEVHSPQSFVNWIKRDQINRCWQHYLDVNENDHVCSGVPDVGSFIPYDVHLAKNGACTINGVQVDSGSGGGCDRNDYLFCVNQNGVASYHANMRLFFCQIRSGSELVRDYVPVVRCSDWQAGLFDRVTREFYGNAGSGRFCAGGAKIANRVSAELYIDVPKGKTALNATTKVRGLVTVIKTGEGVYVPICNEQDYVGGTDVRAGILRGNEDSEDVDVRYGLQKMDVRIGSGASLDVNGQYGLYRYRLVLDGGEVGNTVKNVPNSYAQLANVVLTTNSSLNVKYDMGLIAHSFTPASIDLGGYELTTTIAPLSDRYFYLYNGVLTNGTFNLAKGGWCVIDKTGLEARTVDFVVKCALEINVPSHVRGYSAQCPANFNKGTAPLNVHGTFEPVTDYFYGCTLQNGSTLDLSKKTQTWSTTGAFTNGLNTVVFADHATVTIELGDRKPRDGELVVSWNEVPENLSTLSFVRPKDRLGKFYTTDEGIVFSLGMIILVR